MSYRRTPDYSWEFYPPPYSAVSPVRRPGTVSGGGGSSLPPLPILVPAVSRGTRGMAGCGCGCGGHCSGGGLGLFDSTDFGDWGIAEWGAIAIGAYVALKLVGDVGSVRKQVRRRHLRKVRKAIA